MQKGESCAMKDTTQTTDAKRKREKPVVGPRVAKDLLQALREMRGWEARDVHTARYRSTEEIEAWEDLIRASVKDWRTAPREVLDMDRETTTALDEACGFHGNRGYANTDRAREHRRTFALRAIKAVCQAWVNAGPGARPYDMAVTLRELTEDEKAAELLVMRSELKGA
jgi:hypothetical protein